MPTAITEIPARPDPLQPPRKRWTRAECASVQTLGLWRQEHLELVEGELISKTGKNQSHMVALTLLHTLLTHLFGPRLVATEAPIDVAPEDNSANEPEPDIIVLTKDVAHFRSARPRPADLHLVVEIADTTLAFDLTTKAALYARAAINEYWVLDSNSRRLLVHRDPKSGAYASIVAYSENESVAPLASPRSEFRVADAFS